MKIHMRSTARRKVAAHANPLATQISIRVTTEWKPAPATTLFGWLLVNEQRVCRFNDVSSAQDAAANLRRALGLPRELQVGDSVFIDYGAFPVIHAIVFAVANGTVTLLFDNNGRKGYLDANIKDIVKLTIDRWQVPFNKCEVPQ